MDNYFGDENKKIALSLWSQGKQPSFSHDLSGTLTCGYGKLDFSGEFQYPLEPPEEYFQLVKNLRKAGVEFVI